MPGQDRTEAHEAVQPALAAGGAEVSQMVGPMVTMWVSPAGSGAEEVEVDAVHGLRPICGSCFQHASKHGTIRIRKILET
jgi:hypothetical protein